MGRWFSTGLRGLAVACQGLLVAALAPGVAGADGGDVALRWGLIGESHGRFIVRGQEPAPVQPLDTLQPLDVVQPTDVGPSAPGYAATQPAFDLGRELSAQIQQALASGPTAAESVSGTEARILAATDAGDVLADSNSVQTVNIQQRSQVALDPYVRGYRADQILTQAHGGYWPARRDLDTMLSKIDPSLIQDAIVIAGPYGLRYGPGMAVIDVVTSDAPRYQDGYESHFRTGLTFRGNGSQMYARQTAYGGSCNWGYLLNWGLRDGSDYTPGEAAPFEHIPSSYSAQNFLAQFGFDLSDTSRLEIRYQRLDETDTEFAAQFFDINFLGMDAVTLSLIDEDDCNCSRFQVDAWYNFTRFNGDTDTQRAGLDPDPDLLRKRGAFPVIDRVESALADLPPSRPADTVDLFGRASGDLTSLGLRVFRRYGDRDTQQIEVGADIRYVEQRLQEVYRISELNPLTNMFEDSGNFGPNPFGTNMPRAYMVDPGLYAQASWWWLPYLRTTIGGRFDYVETDADEEQLRANPSINGAPGNFAQDDRLYGFFLTNELNLNRCWTVNFGGGHAERVPSLVDRYGDGVFLGMIQSGFNRVIGEPTLAKERAWQIDVGADGDYGWWRIGGSGYYAWIDNYHLYQGLLVSDPLDARLLRARNAELVTLAGCEGYLDVSITDRLSAFGNFRYVEGRDRNIEIGGTRFDQPLYGVIPMEGRVGLRLIDCCQGQTWGFEFGARIVNNQDQVADLRLGATDVTNLDAFELETPGFTTFYMRGYYNASENLSFVGGIENLYDRAYYEHLNLRLPNDPQQPPGDPRSIDTLTFAPGITPYFGVEWNY